MRSLGPGRPRRQRPVSQGRAPYLAPSAPPTRLQRANAVLERWSRRLKGPRTVWLARGGAIVFLGATLVYGLAVGGHFAVRGSSLKALLDEGSAMVGLAASEISITGLHRQSREAVLAAIGVEEGRSLVGFDAAEARDALQRLDWVASASVLRLFPNRLHIELRERVPYALWQDEGEFYVIDSSGMAMTQLPVRKYRDLPVVVGKGANEAAVTLINQLEAQPALKSMVRAAVRVAERRWTLYLANGIKVALPDGNVAGALARLMTLTDRYGLMTRDIVSVDLRLPDRVTVRLSDEAVEREAKGPALARR
ncbi:cell division protein FtsQ/DivIB [Kaustia mangrovi]|uniref:Cell division protein FtsQ n=1 Tax=Kaustia mangrovi TaxID=2593653 RepID=A0A7S8C7L2_9HYPH|nr:cell division protein FtsQ/DivIB [Kaustia mangrovi]QPC44888.1 cell division protein FtsQ/DivIB [Kaustia mangrovi]